MNPRRLATVAAVLVLALVLTTAPVAAGTNTAIGSNHTTDSDFNSADTLSNVTVVGSGNVAFVDYDPKFFEGFENEPADSGVPDNWEAVTDPSGNGQTRNVNTEEVSTAKAVEGSQSYHVSEGTVGNVIYTRPQEQPYSTTRTSNVSVSFLSGSNAGDEAGINLYEGTGDDPQVRLQLLSGELIYFNATGEMRTITSEPGGDAWMNVTIFDIDPAANTISVEWSSDTASGVATDIEMWNSMSNGYDNTILRSNNVGWFDAVEVDDRSADAVPGTYIGSTHTVGNAAQGFANLTLINASATVTWQENTSGSWSDIRTDTYTTSGNKTVDISSATAAELRVNVTFEPTGSDFTGELHDEGVLFTNHDPEFDGGSASPTGALTSDSQTLEIDVNDSEFGTPQGDSVTVEFFVDGSSVGTDTITSNGTASVSDVTFSGGDAEWNASAADSYGGSNNSDVFSVTVPSNLTIREETSPYDRITGCSANVRFFETTDDNPVITEVTDADQDGRVSLAGLPVGSQFVATVKCAGYHNRTTVIDSIFEQNSVFLLNKSRASVEVRFKIDDRTGEFGERSEFIIQKAVNRSKYDSGGFQWTNIAGDELGASSDHIVDLEDEDRYRLKVQNDEGDTRILGAYNAEVSGTEDVVVGQISWPSTPGNATRLTANISDTSQLGNTPPVIVVTFQDPQNQTTDFEYKVFEQGNRSNKIGSGGASGTLGSFYSEVNVTENQSDKNWIVEANYTHDGEDVTQQRIVGDSGVDISIDPNWLGTFSLLAITMVGLLYGRRTATVGVVLMYATAGVFMIFQFIVISPAWYIVSGVLVAGAVLHSEVMR